MAKLQPPWSWSPLLSEMLDPPLSMVEKFLNIIDFFGPLEGFSVPATDNPGSTTVNYSQFVFRFKQPHLSVLNLI